jgi:hypothetical protein
MIRTRVGAAVLRAYPADTRATVGAEMLSTLLDASAGSRARFVREAVELLRLGLRARATRIAHAGTLRLLADGACVAAIFFGAQDLATALRNRGVAHAVYSSASIAVLAVVLGVALLGHDRIAGAAALAWMAARFSGLTAGMHVADDPTTWMVLICLAIMAASPRRRSSRARPSDLYGSTWLAVLVVLVVLAGGLGGLAAIVALAASTAFGAVGLALLTTDPRPAIAVTLVGANIAVGKVASAPGHTDDPGALGGRAGGPRRGRRSYPAPRGRQRLRRQRARARPGPRDRQLTPRASAGARRSVPSRR